MKKYLVLFVEDNHVYDVITKADNPIEARNKVFDTYVKNTDLVTHGITQEITQKQAKDTDWTHQYIQDWINETFKSE